MKEGYWINFKTNKSVLMADHAIWMRDPENAKLIGVPESVSEQANKIKDREGYLTFILGHAPLIRVRGHGTSVTFEYNFHNHHTVLDAILLWGKKNIGPYTLLNINNLATKENTQILFQDFVDHVKNEGAESIMRVAKVKKPRNTLVKVTQEIDPENKDLM